MLAQAVTILLLLLILGSLFSALYRLMHKREKSASVVKALTLRVALSVGLFLLLLAGFGLGVISPHGMR